MANLFVFTAPSQSARYHLEDSIKSPIPLSNIRTFFSVPEQQRLEEISTANGGLYAWGAKQGKANQRTGQYRNIETWSQMRPGDYVLGVYDNNYRYFAWVQQKFHNVEAAKSIWGVDEEDGETWEYIYFISEPQPLKVAVEETGGYLPHGYIGFTRIAQEKIQHICDHYGSLERFFGDLFHVDTPTGYGCDRCVSEAQAEAQSEHAYAPIDVAEGRSHIFSAIVRRQGLPHLLLQLLSIYEARCVLSNEDCEEVLEAAYILPYKGDHTNHVTNALLLRSDLHLLFDKGLIAVDSKDMSIIVSERLRETSYQTLAGAKLRPPSLPEFSPNREALDIHRKWAGLG